MRSYIGWNFDYIYGMIFCIGWKFDVNTCVQKRQFIIGSLFFINQIANLNVIF